MIQARAVNVVACGEPDGRVIAALHAECFEKPWDAETINQFLRPSLGHGFLARSGSASPQPLGFILYRVAGGESEILTLGVPPPHRRMGIGALLLDAASEQARKLGARRLFLEVAETNAAAIALYQGKGFKRVGLRPDYFDLEGGRCDAFVLARELITGDDASRLETRVTES